MINPFNISNNKRYTINNRTIIIEEVHLFRIAWYYLDEWWKKQPRIINLHKSNKLSLMLKAEKYKYSE